MSFTRSTAAEFVVRCEIDEREGPSTALIERLNSACDDIEDASSSGILELRLGRLGESAPAWPAGASLDRAHKWEKAIRRLERLRGITLAVAEGRCGVAAMDVLAVADHRIADSTLSLRVAAKDSASWPSAAMYRIAARSGQSAARALFLFATDLTAAESVRFSLVDDVADDAERARDDFVLSLAGRDLAALASRRLLLLEGLGQGYDKIIGLHLAACDVELRRRDAPLQQDSSSRNLPVEQSA